MKEKNFKLPTFGVGPIFVLTCLCITLGGLYLDHNGYLNQGQVQDWEIIFNILGLGLIALGLYLWIQAVIVEKINKQVQEGQLITNGVYGLVRNPVYSAFIFIFTGILFQRANLILLILPVIFWIFLTLLMKATEEKWLREKFGKDYEIYSAEVNRVIPWPRRKRK